MKSGVAFVVNPASGSGRGRRIWERIEPKARELGFFEAALTQEPRHGVELARRYAEEGWPRIIAVGGDGTLNEVLNGAMGSDSAIGSVPLGTGNDWIRTVGISKNPEQALMTAFEGIAVPSDVGEVDGQGYFLNVMGAGFDAEVARRIADAKGLLKRLGPTPRYLAATLATFRTYKSPTIRMCLDGKAIEVPQMLLAAIGIARYYGSGMKILPDAQTDDGLFDLIWGSDIKFLELPGLMRKIFSGRHVQHPKTTSARAVEIELESDTPVPFHIDGDWRGFLPVRARILKHAIQVIVPKTG